MHQAAVNLVPTIPFSWSFLQYRTLLNGVVSLHLKLTPLVSNQNTVICQQIPVNNVTKISHE